MQNAVLCTLYAHRAFCRDSAVTYPLIVTEVNYMVENLKDMPDEQVTPEYAAVHEGIKKELIEVVTNEIGVKVFFLNEAGKEEISRNSDEKIGTYIRIATERIERPRKKTPKKSKDDKAASSAPEISSEDKPGDDGVIDLIDKKEDDKTDDECGKSNDSPKIIKRSMSDASCTNAQQQSLPPPPPKRLRISKSAESAQACSQLLMPPPPLPPQPPHLVPAKKPPGDHDDDVELLGIKRRKVICLDDDNSCKGDGRGPSSADAPKVIDITGEPKSCTIDITNEEEEENKSEKEAYRKARQSKLIGEDRLNALKYPPLNMMEVFSEHSKLCEDAVPPIVARVKLIVDTREPVWLREKIRENFKKFGLEVEEKALFTGDYIWAAVGVDGREYLLNAIVERKTVEDFDESIRKGNRYANQVRKMKASGISNIIYIIEGRADREFTMNNVPFEEIQTQIANVHKRDNLKLIREMDNNGTMSFLVRITQNLMTAHRKGTLTKEFFAYPLKDSEGLKNEVNSNM